MILKNKMVTGVGAAGQTMDAQRSAANDARRVSSISLVFRVITRN